MEAAGLPSAIWRWSTRDFKVTPILRHYRSFGGHVNQYLDIAFDEVERMKASRVDYVTNLYPLIQRRITRFISGAPPRRPCPGAAPLRRRVHDITAINPSRTHG
jgi:hypothetical protein